MTPLMEARAQAAVLRQVFSLELRRAFAYRVEFWIRFAGVIFANVAIAYFLWQAIFAQTGSLTIEGYTFRGMILYYLLVPLTENITRSSTEHGAVSAEIYSGSLTRYLIYPVAFFPYRYAATAASGAIAVTALVIVLTSYGFLIGWPPEMPFSTVAVVTGLVAACYGSLLNFLLVSMVEMVAFWADNTWSLNVMLMFSARLLGGALLPLSLLPSGLQAVLHYTPFPYLVSFPVLAMLGKVDHAAFGEGIMIMTSWILALGAIDALIWRRGNRKYTGVGV